MEMVDIEAGIPREEDIRRPLIIPKIYVNDKLYFDPSRNDKNQNPIERGPPASLCKIDMEKWVWLTGIVDMGWPMLLMSARNAYNLSPIGLETKTGSWKNAPFTNTLMTGAELLQMIMGFMLILRLLKILKNVSLANWFRAYKALSALIGFLLLFVLLSTISIQITDTTNVGSGAQQFCIMFQYTLLLLLRINATSLMDDACNYIESHAKGEHVNCKHDPNSYINIW